MTTTQAPDTKPKYRAGYRNARHYFDTLEEAAAHVRDNGGPVDRLAGKLYRTIPAREQDAAIAALSSTQ